MTIPSRPGLLRLNVPIRKRVFDKLAQRKALDVQTRAAAAFVPDPATGKAGFGLLASGRHVSNVQARLKAAGFKPGLTAGTFDAATELALKKFQKLAKLPVTGWVDPRTWAKLEKSFIYAKGKKRWTDPMQALGEKSAGVLRSEKLLKKLGYKTGKVDGLFDRKTLAAAKRYERVHKGVGSDGQIGTKQLEQMSRTAHLSRLKLAPAGTSMRKQFLYYSEMVRAAGGKVNPGGKPTVLGIRGLSRSGRLGETTSRAAYDDTFIVLTRNGRVREIRGATHAGQNSSTLSDDINGDGQGDVGMIRPGNYTVVPNGPHHGAPSYHVRTLANSGNIPGWRDTNHDGRFSRSERKASQRRGIKMTAILFHQGDSTRPSSIGCQTLAPREYAQFMRAVGGSSARFSFTLVDAARK
jgi:peptidoglycan hydrolase-like protein with peptidoglycan-binding domain